MFLRGENVAFKSLELVGSAMVNLLRSLPIRVRQAVPPVILVLGFFSANLRAQEPSAFSVAIKAIEQAHGDVTVRIQRGVTSTRVELYESGGWNGGDAGLKHLQGLKNLRHLRIHSHQVTNAGMQYLAGLNELESLHLDSTPISDDALVHIVHLPKLAHLSLSGTQITDRGLVQLSGAKAIATIDLSNTAVSNEGLVHLRGLPALKDVDLSKTKVTNAGCDILASFPALVDVKLDNTRVTIAGAEALRKKVPPCIVHFSTLLNDDEKAAIRKVVANIPDIDHHIVSIGSRNEAGEVEVKTGFVIGPLFAGGDFLILKFDAGQWKLVSKGHWVS